MSARTAAISKSRNVIWRMAASTIFTLHRAEAVGDLIEESPCVRNRPASGIHQLSEGAGVTDRVAVPVVVEVGEDLLACVGPFVQPVCPPR